VDFLLVVIEKIIEIAMELKENIKTEEPFALAIVIVSFL